MRFAVVTPFRAQIGVLRQALKQTGLGGENITIGTVHTLQGAEKDVVLFSPVYGASHSGGLFFDRGVSMPNVAVSRARESFLVFGDIRLFRPRQPSGLLATFLFSDSGNEITNIEPVSRIVLEEEPADLERLNDLDSHRGVPRRAIGEANERVLIVSPYLSNKAIEADDLAPLLQAHRDGPQYRRRLRPLSQQRPQPKPVPNAARAIDILSASGAEVWALNGAHNRRSQSMKAGSWKDRSTGCRPFATGAATSSGTRSRSSIAARMPRST